MVARRGKPEVMISDNHMNFTLAERKLCDLVSTLDQTWIKEQVADDGIQWQFKSLLFFSVDRIIEEFSCPYEVC